MIDLTIFIEMAREYLQGVFKPKNPSKYVGDATKIFFRSSWELKLFVFLDSNPNIIAWGSEELIIPYYDKTEGRYRRYFPDIVVKYKDKDGMIKKSIIEVKPEAQTRPPVKGKRTTKRYMEEVKTYITNQCKWEAAVAFAKQNGFDSFQILSESQLGIK